MKDTIFDIVKQGTHVNTPIKQIDLRLGTTCNLACRMCSPISSSMWSQIVEENEQAFKDGEWNQYRVLAKGSRIQTWINGEMIEDLIDEEIYKTHPRGIIGLQVHGIGKNSGPFTVQWRNIKIKEL